MTPVAAAGLAVGLMHMPRLDGLEHGARVASGLSNQDWRTQPA